MMAGLYLAAVAAGPLAPAAVGQSTLLFADKTVPLEEGFRVYLVPDMEGMGSAVHPSEIIAGNEAPRYRDVTGPDYWSHYRQLLTQEANAVIAGAREAGAASFVVNEGHGGNRFANVIPWELDPQALLIRGYPKPMVMSTGIDSTFGTMIFTGAHASPPNHAVMSHNYAFDLFTVNGKRLNEVAINALIGGAKGVSVSMVSGDDVLVAETQEMLGNGVIGVVTKVAVGHNAAVTYSPARVREMLRVAAEEAVRRELAGDFEPFVMDRPYRVEFTLRASYPDEVVAAVDTISTYGLEKVAGRTYRMVTDDVDQIGYLLDAVEEIVLP